MTDIQPTKTIEAPTSKADKPHTANVRQNRFALYCSFLLALLAVAAAALALWQNQQMTQSINRLNRHGTEINALQQSLSARQKTLNQTQQNISTLETSIAKQNLEIETLQNTLANAKPIDTPSDSFMLQKVRFLLELSKINANWSHDSQSNLALLQDADTILSQISSASVYPVRQALTKEISLWQALPTLDTAGILNQLDELIHNIDTLPFIQTNNSLNTATKSHQGLANTWKEGLHDSIAFLQKLVIIRYHDAEINPLISPMHEAILRDGLRIQLYEAQWAVLTQDDVLFKQALSNALDTCKKTFTSDSADTVSLIEHLTALQALSLTHTKPTASTLELVNHLINQGLNKAVNKPSTNP